MKKVRFFIAVCEEEDGRETHHRLPSERIETHLQLSYALQLKNASKVLKRPVIRFFNVKFEGSLRPVGTLLEFLWQMPLPINKARGKKLTLGEAFCLFMDYAVQSHTVYHG